MKREDRHRAIECDSYYGPVFGYQSTHDINIGHYCNEEDSCSINNDDTHGYECHSQYKFSLSKSIIPSFINSFNVLRSRFSINPLQS